MIAQQHDYISIHRRCRIAYAGLLLLLLLAGVADAAESAQPGISVTRHAEAVDSGWTVSPQFYVAGATTRITVAGESIDYQSVANTFLLQFSSPARSASAGLFADFRFAVGAQGADVASVGAYFKYRFQGWDATAYAFVEDSRGGSDTWYAARVRYALADGHKLGILAAAPVEQVDKPMPFLAYDGSLTELLSVEVSAGTGFGQGPDFVSRIELSWQVW